MIIKKATCLFVGFIIFISFSGITAFSVSDNTVPSVSAQTYVLYCVNDGKIYCANNENKKMKPASTTKIITSLIALEYANANNKNVEFTKEMLAEGSSMYLGIGDEVKLSDLAAGMMMASGNDAANATAISISGSFEKFAELMNTKAKQIGMKNTHFVTPSGLDDENHYSTAYDMSLLMAYALENEDFAKLTAQKSATVDFIKPNDKRTTYANHNRLLSLYSNCVGGKTGYTMAAGRCLVSAATKDGLTFVCTTMNDRNDWNDHIALYEYAFENYACIDCDDSEFYIDVPCVGGDKDVVTLVGAKGESKVVPSKDKNNVKKYIYVKNFYYAPFNSGDELGKIEYILNGKVVAKIPLTACENNNYIIKNKSIITKIKEFLKYG